MDISVVGIIGASKIGIKIAQLAAMSGYKVIMYDILEHALKLAVNKLENDLSFLLKQNLLSSKTKRSCLKNITMATEIDKISVADIVIEAVNEDLVAKKSVFEKCNWLLDDSAIIVTTTGFRSIGEISNGVEQADRVAGLHFVDVGEEIKFVEIIKTYATSFETVILCEQFCKSLGKETVIINESPGFIASRMDAVIINEAFTMLMHGVGSAEDIDKAFKLGLNHTLGVFEKADTLGLDEVFALLKYLELTVDSRYKPCPLITSYVNTNRLGVKTGRGVYIYK